MSQNNSFSRIAIEVILLTENFDKLSGCVPPFEYYRDAAGHIVQVEQIDYLPHNMVMEIIQQSGVHKEVFLSKYETVTKLISEQLLKYRQNNGC